jgi:hypothetical protein
MEQKIWRETPNAVINLRATATNLIVIEKCKSKSVLMSQICDVFYGIKTGDNNKYLSNKPSNTFKVKALKTGEIVRYNIKWKGIYLWWCAALAGYRTSSLEVPKIVVQYIRKLSLPRRIISALDLEGIYYPLNNYSYVVNRENNYSLKYILGVLNSSLLNFYFSNTYIDYNIKPTYLQELPIRTINFSDAADKARHDRMVAFVEQMLSLNKKLAAAKAEHEKTSLQRQIETTDHQIDRLVYDLYELTDQEIEIVEGNE